MCVVQLYILDNKKYNHISTKKLLLTFYSGFSSVTQVQSIFNEKQPNVFKRTIRMLYLWQWPMQHSLLIFAQSTVIDIFKYGFLISASSPRCN